ncbi:hypothetical protein MRB53_019717 [Persea americana]|uniref:Uncharacterized protein n=1 Tax=Persea americana TaxID=3435 RepID=A0ACC2KZB6_PERAE|nr:hypothetical protein MRB53_019717 [Persea americana]
MGICGEDDSGEEDRFFDSKEDFSSLLDSGSGCADGSDCNGRVLDWVSENFRYEVWIGKPDSVQERRDRFLKWLSVGSLDPSDRSRESADLSGGEIAADTGRVRETSGAVLRRSFELGNGLSSSMSSVSNDTPDQSDDGVSMQNFMCRIRNLDDGTEFIMDGLGQDGTLSRLREVGSNRLYTVDEFQRVLGLSPLVQQFMRREATAESNLGAAPKRRKRGWLRRLGAVACVVHREQEEGSLQSDTSGGIRRVGGQRVRVRPNKKRSKELSALYMGQEIQGHVGSILTMKFSPDGRYLASAGEDGVVRVWQVLMCARTDEINIPNVDPSCIYFAVNGSSEVAPLFADKEKMGKFSSMRKTPDSACVILPPKLFRISDKPLHEFHGHNGEILDLSWSKKQHLLSSSVDKSVRLWRVGHDQCLKVFYHSDFVTCVEFNPDDDNYFISGSIDRKVRIWDISGLQVVDWTDIRDIVTAVCYQPNGKGCIVGSFKGNCRFYNTSGNHLQLEHQICLQGKKKSPTRRITGFQYSPSDPMKVMVTSSDSQVRILDGPEVISKYRGLKNAGSQISASFSSDGRHIISASEDSNVYIWNYGNSEGTLAHQRKSIWSYERFFSRNVSVAIPWSGMKPESSASFTSETLTSDLLSQQSFGSSDNGSHCHTDSCSNTRLFPSPEHFLLGHGFFSDILPRGSATWPEEKLPSNTMTVSSAVCKSQYKLLKTSCQNTITSPHAWGLVIVTAGLDGRIRSFHNYGLPVRV